MCLYFRAHSKYSKKNRINGLRKKQLEMISQLNQDDDPEDKTTQDVATPQTASRDNKHLELNPQLIESHNSSSYKPTNIHEMEEMRYERLNHNRKYDRTEYLTPQDQIGREQSKTAYHPEHNWKRY